MLLSSAAAEKEKAFFEEIKIANQRFQSTNNELTRLSVNFEQSNSESQAFQAERDKLVQDNGRLAQSEAAHELKVHSLELAKQRTTLEVFMSQSQQAMDSMTLAIKFVGARILPAS
jgi:hypothetical protein